MSLASLTYASALGGSLSRSTAPEPQIVARLTNPHIPAARGRVNFDPSEPSDLAASMSLSADESEGHTSVGERSEWAAMVHPIIFYCFRIAISSVSSFSENLFDMMTNNVSSSPRYAYFRYLGKVFITNLGACPTEGKSL
ncbi:unnamed protein product [Lactuca saligna]|uniref:Uncharacterized protein n=1 Tax=Lactuca saligna TaxID=75948 RepID=A0AA35VRB6_LACSI|nr:unnamed protein product [Lactuca saligna]